MAMMKPKERERYEVFFYYKKRPKYIPMKPEDIARLSYEDRQEYENSSKIQDT
jgi:hypothetical protein